MIVITWNLCRFQPRKVPAIRALLEDCDLLCLTETWSSVPNDDTWQSFNSIHVPANNNRAVHGGGVALVLPAHMPFRLRERAATKHIQFVVGTLAQTQVMGCYVSPKTPAHVFQEFLETANTKLRGNGVLLGALNARDRAWDSTCSRRGQLLRRWAIIHKFATQRPDRPSFHNTCGTSNVDLCFHRNGVPPHITVLAKLALSDHAPVKAEFACASVTDR